MKSDAHLTERDLCIIQKMIGSGTLETVQESPLGMRYMWKTLAGLRILLDSRFRGNDEYWFFAQSL